MHEIYDSFLFLTIFFHPYVCQFMGIEYIFLPKEAKEIMQSTFFPHFTIGTDAYDKVPEICGDYGKTAVIIGGNKSRAAAEPLIRKVCEGHIEILGSFLYGDDATFENAEALTKIPEVQKADMVFAVGGGRATDTTKWACHMMHKPIFTFPTLASNCASVTAVCAIYNPDHSFRCTAYRDRNPYHTFINTEIVAHSPREYFWAGLGDALAKQYEVPFCARGRSLNWVQEAGVANAQNVAAGILKYGKEALDAMDRHEVNFALEQAALAVILAPGMASVCVEDDLDSSLAHAIYNAQTRTPHKGKHLHGAVVNYGLQVLLDLDGQIEERDKIRAFALSINLPHCLKDIGIDPAHPEELIENCLHTKDMKVKPYDITYDMVYRSVMKLEELNRQGK